MSSAPWDLERIRGHVAAHLPLAGLLGIEVAEAEPGRSLVRLADGPHLARPGGAVAGPVLFAMADIGTYALTLALRQEDAAATASLFINFFRPALDLPLLAEAVPLRAGRRLATYDVRVWPEAAGPGRLVAQATATWAMAGGEGRP